LRKFFPSRRVSSAVGEVDLKPSGSPAQDIFGSTQIAEPPEGWGKGLLGLLEFWAPPSLTDEDDWKVYYILNNKIIDERENPFVVKQNVMNEDGSVSERRIGHGQPPFVVQRCYHKRNQDGYLGFYDVEGIAEHLEGIQWNLNEASRALMILTRRAAMPPYFEEENSLADPGIQVEYKPGESIVYKSGKNPPQPLAQGLESAQPQYLHDKMEDLLSEMSGVRKFMTGEMPQGTSHTPQGTVMFSQEASFIRMPDIVRELDKTILSMGKLILGNLQQFEQPGTWRNIAIAGEQAWAEWTEKHIQTEFNLEVVSGMTTILRDIDRQQNATNIYQAVLGVLANPTPPLLRATKQWLLMLDEPSGYGYMALIDEEIQKQEQMQQLMAAMPQETMPPTAAPTET